MKLTYRAMTQDDFGPFFDICFYGDRDNAALRQVVEYEWQVLLNNPATLSLVVEDGERPAGQRLIGCAQAVFVTDGFVQAAKAATAPGVNVQVTHPMAGGTSPFLTPAQVGQDNIGGGLNALWTRWRRADELLTPPEKMIMGRFLKDSFQTFTRGYRLKEILIEAIGEAARDQALRAGFHQRSDYAAHYHAHPPLPPPAKRPFLMGVTREEGLATEGCSMADYFVYIPPRFHFKPHEQELLRLCQTMQDAPSEQLAQTLDVPLGSVKNWWIAIYGRVMDVDPGLLPQAESSEKRGPEKRRRLLQYLRDHPEELRPCAKPRFKDKRIPPRSPRPAQRS